MKLDNMSTRGYIPEHLSATALKKLLLEALGDVPNWSSPETFHALFDHLERGLSTDDIIHGIEREWTFERPPKFDHDHWQWRYYLAAESVDGDPITIVVAVNSRDREFVIVTRWRGDEE